ncbi:MAG: HPr family phosphocarrier protein [Oscillospiraceae bacterium]|nr:HPr family phosphocarrier protein [Oscillospiraceae bacterium]
MKEFNYTITDAVGIHARPAGLLAKKASEYSSTVTIVKGERKADTRRLMALMSLGIKCGDTITIQTEGADEEKAACEISAFLTDNKY